jgi:hypothetical protein
VNFNGATNGPFLTVNANSNTLLINGNWTTGGNRWSGIVVNNGTVTMANGLNGGSSTNNGVYAVLNGGTLNLNNNFAIGGAGAGNNLTINGGTLDNTSGSAKTLGTNPFMRINADFAFSTSGGTSANDLNLGTGAKELCHSHHHDQRQWDAHCRWRDHLERCHSEQHHQSRHRHAPPEREQRNDLLWGDYGQRRQVGRKRLHRSFRGYC